MKEIWRKGILRERKPRIYVVHPEGEEYYEQAKQKGGKEILYLNKRISREEFNHLKKKGLKSIPAIVFDPDYIGGQIVHYFPADQRKVKENEKI